VAWGAVALSHGRKREEEAGQVRNHACQKEVAFIGDEKVYSM